MRYSDDQYLQHLSEHRKVHGYRLPDMVAISHMGTPKLYESRRSSRQLLDDRLGQRVLQILRTLASHSSFRSLRSCVLVLSEK